jgi:hypothetical protein
MAFTTQNIEDIRLVLGFDRLFLASNPFLDSALQAIQSVADGGSAPDDTVVNNMLAALTQVQAINATINQILTQPTNLAVTEIPTALTNGATLKQSYSAALDTLRYEGTMLIQQMAIMVGLKPLRSFFYGDGNQRSSTDFYPRFFTNQNR